METHDKLGKIARGAGLMAFAYFVSRILGLVREQIIAWRYGATAETDLYNASFLIPDYLFHLLAGGAFSIVLIPMLARHITDDDRPRVDAAGAAIFSRVFFPLALTMLALTVFLEILAPQLSWLLYPDYQRDPYKFALLVKMTRIVLPAQAFFLVGGLYNSVNRACGDFRGNALAPNIYNLGIIAGALFLAPLLGIAGLSAGALAGAFAGSFVVCYLLSRRYIRQRISWRFFSPEFKEYILLSLPLMLGFSLLSIDQWFVRYFGAKSGVATGTITCINYARTIMLIPIGLIGQSVGQASLTYLSRLWQQGKREEYSATFRQTLSGLLFLTIALAGFIFLAARPIITVLFQHGAFAAKPENSRITASFLRILVLAIPAFSLQQTLVNGYYAKKDTLRPMFIATAVSVTSFFIYWFLQRLLAGTGIAIAAVIGFWLLLLVTLADYLRRYGRNEGFDVAPLAMGAAKTAAVCAGACLAIPLLFRLLPGGWLSPHRLLPALLLIAMQGAAYLGIVTGLTLALGGPESALLKRLAGGFRRRLLRRPRP